MEADASAGEGRGKRAGAANKKPRVPAILWRGILVDARRPARIAIFAVIAVACVSLTFVMLGFSGLGFKDHYVAYVVPLLLPVSLGALLFGTLRGTALGLLAGLVLYAHAKAMPLDYYELAFVTPVSSILMLAAAGFLLGMLFARGLRGQPGRGRRALSITVSCFVVSLLYSMGFISVVAGLLMEQIGQGVASSAADAVITSNLARTAGEYAARLGSVSIQAGVDGALMAAVCVIGDAAVSRAAARPEKMGLRTLFASWFAVIVLIAFMITSAVSFVAISADQLGKAETTLASEVGYLGAQLERYDMRVRALNDVLGPNGLAAGAIGEDGTARLLEAFAPNSLLTGYSKEIDGTVVITPADDDVVLLSDDPRFSVGDRLHDHLSNETLASIETSIETDAIQRIVYDEIDIPLLPLADLGEDLVADAAPGDRFIHTQIAYLCATRSGDYMVVMILPSDMVFESRSAMMAWTTASTLALLLSLFVLAGYLLSRSVVRRIDETNETLGQITRGNLEARVNVHDTQEFDELSCGINETVDALKGWISEAGNRIDAELATAKAIQEAALPRIFPPFPDNHRFDIYALMDPAREVGGDFYDFFLIGEDPGAGTGRLGFVVADVSGKGVPAALFMMTAKTLVRNYMRSGVELGEAVENANRQLCETNTADMFVTLFAGVLDYRSGHVDYVNAGHNPALLWQRSGWRWLRRVSGMPLGLFDNLPYTTFSVDCEIGDEFLIYTDGVTEAMDADGRQYGEERLMAIATDHFTMHPRELIETVKNDIGAHVLDAEQSDDITMLALEVGVPPEITATLTVPALVEELDRVTSFIHTELDRRLCPVRTQKQLDVAVEELFVNVANYAYPEATPENPGSVHVCYTYSADPPSITVDIADDGIPYNPLAKPDVATPSRIDDVPIGGLGILMAKRSVDEMSYERVDGSNVVTIRKRW